MNAEKADHKYVWWIGGVCLLALVVLVYFSRRVLTPFFIAFTVAYLLDPVVDRMEAKKIPRTPSVLILMSAFFLVLAAVVALLFPLLQVQAENFIQNLPRYIAVVHGWVEPLLERLAGIDQAKAQAILKDTLAKFGTLPLKVLSAGSDVLWGSLSGLLNIILMIANLVIIPVAMFYLLRDFDEINDKALALIPGRFRDSVLALVKDIDATLAGFVRGQLMAALLMGILYCIGLFACGTPMSLFIGLAAGLASLVPYLGLVLGFVPAAFMTFAQSHEWMSVLGVAGVFAVVQALEGMVITPRVVGDSIGLHPIVIMVAVLLGAEFFGFVGVLLGVPIAAVINVLCKKGLDVYKESSFFNAS